MSLEIGLRSMAFGLWVDALGFFEREDLAVCAEEVSMVYVKFSWVV